MVIVKTAASNLIVGDYLIGEPDKKVRDASYIIVDPEVPIDVIIEKSLATYKKASKER